MRLYLRESNKRAIKSICVKNYTKDLLVQGYYLNY